MTMDYLNVVGDPLLKSDEWFLLPSDFADKFCFINGRLCDENGQPLKDDKLAEKE